MSDLVMKLSQSQLQILLDLSRSIPTVFAGEPVAITTSKPAAVDETLPQQAPPPTDLPNNKYVAPASNLHPELGVISGTWTKIDLIFGMGDVSLELLLCSPSEPIKD